MHAGGAPSGSLLDRAASERERESSATRRGTSTILRPQTGQTKRTVT